MRLFRLAIFYFLGFILISCKNDIVKPMNSKFEAYRPMYHFTPDAMWMNDPNGLVFYKGEYHLFYQFYPDSTVWGPMHWGHAVSKDMINWHQLPIALYPDSLGYIFSGSAVIDWENTSGFGINGQAPMIAIFTYHNMEGEKAGKIDFQSQAIAFSNDMGRTWTKFTGNPVIKNPGIKDFRDPKVIWHEESQNWILVLAARDKVKFYQSKDLKVWKHISDFGIAGDSRLWECPDLFPIKVNNENEEKWVLITSMQSGAPNGGTGSSYWIGDFDGKEFKCKDIRANQKWLDEGKDNYAFVTWSDVPKSDSRRLGIGWMSNWQYAQKVPSVKWRSAMTMPRELKLFKAEGDYVLHSIAIDEFKNYEVESRDIDIKTIKDTSIIIENHSLIKLAVKCQIPLNGMFSIRLSNKIGEFIDVGYDASDKKYFIDRSNSGITAFSSDFSGRHESSARKGLDTLQMEVYLDHSSVELFAEYGKLAMTDIFFANPPYSKVQLMSSEETVDVYNVSVTKMKAIDARK